MFSSKGTDEAVIRTPNYRRINTSCSQMNLSSSNLDVKTFRELIHCFNSNQALDAVDQLIGDFNDQQLSSIVDVLNRYVLHNKKLLFQIESTYGTLVSRGMID